MAQKNKNSKVFIQSHNSKSTKIEKSFSKYSVHKVVKKISGNWNVCRIAVSEEAGKWLFNPDDKFKIINNPVDVNRFKFSFKDRTYIRRKYNISEDEILFGNVARMDYQKNPLYLVKIFKEIRQINKKIKLILIGSGVLKNEVTEFIYKNKLEKDVIIIDWTDKVWMFYSAIDEIIFPSLYEGFPLSLIEAQCSGCNIVYSDTVTKDIQLLETTISFPLRRSAVEWAKLSLKNFDVYQLNKFEKRIEASNMLLDKGLDYQTYIKMLMKLYD
jgi:glycosyltransferase involved in cell wall biosynthesis